MADKEKSTESKDLTIEETFEELEKIADNLEKGDLSLEDSFKAYERGMKLLKSAGEKVDAVEKQIKIISENGSEDSL